MVFKRKYRIVPFIVLAFVVGLILVRCIVQFQLGKEISYYKFYFEQRKDGLQNTFNPLDIKQIPTTIIDKLYSTHLSRDRTRQEVIDWDKFAYINYVTDAAYLCNSLMAFKMLKEQGSKAKLHLLVSRELVVANGNDETASVKPLLEKITEIDEEQVVIDVVDNIVKPNDYSQWNESLTKLLVFNQTQYDRVIYFDNDALVKAPMDELFFLPAYIQFAAPVSYWFLTPAEVSEAYHDLQFHERVPTNINSYLDVITNRIDKEQMIYNHLPALPAKLYLNSDNIAQEIISTTSSTSPLFDFNTSKTSKAKFASNLMVISPSEKRFNKIMTELLPKIIKKKEKYDMDLINEELYSFKKIVTVQFDVFRRLRSAFKPKVLVLPFSRYGLLTGSITNKRHHTLLANDILGYKDIDNEGNEHEKSIEDIVTQAKYIHFSDYPIGKPWQYQAVEDIECPTENMKNSSDEEQAASCKLWMSLYSEQFLKGRMCKAKGNAIAR